MSTSAILTFIPCCAFFVSVHLVPLIRFSIRQGLCLLCVFHPQDFMQSGYSAKTYQLERDSGDHCLAKKENAAATHGSLEACICSMLLKPASFCSSPPSQCFVPTDGVCHPASSAESPVWPGPLHFCPLFSSSPPLPCPSHLQLQSDKMEHRDWIKDSRHK